MRRFFAAARVLMALALVVAVAGRLQVYWRFWTARGDQAMAVDVANFFSYFTIQTSLFHAVVFACGAWFLLARRGDDPKWLGAVRAAATTYTVTTGVVHNALLRRIDRDPALEQLWANEVLHTIVPVYALLDWLLAPGRRPVRWRVVGWIVVYPVLWVGYTLVRAPMVLDEGTGNAWWYPYPFLDPHTSAGGYEDVAIWVVVLAVTISAMAAGVVGISRGRRGREESSGPAPPCRAG